MCKGGLSESKLRPIWFSKTIDKSKVEIYSPLSRRDCEILNDAVNADEQNVLIMQGRFMVDLEAREASSVYWDSTPLDLSCGSWFTVNAKCSPVPLSKEDCDICEALYQSGPPLESIKKKKTGCAP